MQKQNLARIAVSYLSVIALAANLSGCTYEGEKSYEYYAKHPEELSRDYQYCETHPSQNVCFNIVKKYFKYQDSNSLTKSGFPTGSIFKNIDEPIAQLDHNG